MIQNGIVSNSMNAGKKSPIIKNNKGSSNDINNTRPLTFLNALSNLFERYLKIQIEKIQNR